MKNSYRLSEIPKHLRKYFAPVTNLVSRSTQEYRPSCECGREDHVPGTVLDPFLGSGTTALVADRLGLDCVGVELSLEYARMAKERVEGDAPMFAEAEIVE